jgi:hypothetical protein
MAHLLKQGLLTTAPLEKYALSWVEALENLKSRQQAEAEAQHKAYEAERTALEKSVEQERRSFSLDLSPDLHQQKCNRLFELLKHLAAVIAAAEVKESRRQEVHRGQLLEHFAKYSRLFPRLDAEVQVQSPSPDGEVRYISPLLKAACSSQQLTRLKVLY